MIEFSNPMSKLRNDFTELEVSQLDSTEASLKEMMEGKRQQILLATDEIDRLREGADRLREENATIMSHLTMILEEKLNRLENTE